MITFGERLRAWRRYRSLTQRGLSDSTGIPQPNVAALESGRVEPKLSTLERLAAGLGVTLGTLLDRRPPQASWSRQQVDALVRKATQKGSLGTGRRNHWAAALRIIAAQKLAAAGHPVALRGRTGERLVKQLRADLGPQIWEAVLRRLDKHV
jgi:transcriptional regulator with XRE-family HTH domain